MVKNIKNALFWALFSNLDGIFPIYSSYERDAIWEKLSVQWLHNTPSIVRSVFNNTAKLHVSVHMSYRL